MSEQITTMTFFHFEGFQNKFWAFKMMRLAIPLLQQVDGCSFFKVVGSGAGEGFSVWPDLGTYGLLQVWQDEPSAKAFFDSAPIFQDYKTRSKKHWITYARHISGGGTWSGHNPFHASHQINSHNPNIMVITRASIGWRSLLKFWSVVSLSQTSYRGNEGLLFSKGIGEIPAVEMATYSLWKSEADLMKFSHDPKGHGKVSQRSVAKKWFKESLFARFQPYKMEGSWKSIDLESIKSTF